jgi:acyl-coenzyme A synthetase/AMP-(fatty) acid ligase
MAKDWSLFAAHGEDDIACLTAEGPVRAVKLWSFSAAIAEALPPPTGTPQLLVACHDRLNFTASLLAAWQRGYVAALPPHAQPQAVGELARRGGIDVLLHDGAVPHAAEGTDVRQFRDVASGPLSELRLPADQPLVKLYTSGSTGVPRGWLKSAAQLIGEATSLASTFRLTPQDRVLATVPPQHIYGLLTGVLAPLVSRAAFVTGMPLFPEDIAALVRSSGATVLASVPPVLRALASSPDKTLPGVRLILSSGAPLDGETAAGLGSLGRSVSEIFGSSETGGIAWREPGISSRWQAMPGVRVSADADARMVVDSPFLDAEQPRPYVGGDCIELDQDGFFRHLGRADGVVKIGAKRVLLTDVEERLRAIPGVSDAAVVSVPADPVRGHEIWAVVASETVKAAELKSHLLNWFDPVVLPRRFRVVTALPRDAAGKLPRSRLLNLFQELASPSAEFEIARALSRLDGGVEQLGLTVRAPAGLIYFQGHFEGHPILPGVVILRDLVLRETQRAWPELRHLRRLARVKFNRPLRPDDTFTLRITRAPGALCVLFEGSTADAVCNSGMLEFKADG